MTSGKTQVAVEFGMRGAVWKLKLREPPSALKPAATARASRRVDLPLPFSPTMKVTARWSGSVSSVRTAGRLNG